jgi:diguanylate cyclase (GGDEF)-like protein
LDCGTGIRELGLDILRSGRARQRIHLLIGHTHWDHIQGFPFFTPAFLPGTELNIYAPSGFQSSLEDSLSGQMQYSYFPVKLQDLSSRIHFTELEEGFFRIGEALIETQYLNHTAPTIAYRITSDNATLAYVTDHEPFWDRTETGFLHPGDQRHVAFIQGADLVIHDSQYTCDEYKTKHGWGHSTIQYATDVAVQAGASRMALFHHDPTHDDAQIEALEHEARQRVRQAASPLEVFAAAEGMEIEIVGRGSTTAVAAGSALERRGLSGSRVLVVTDCEPEIRAIQEVLAEDSLLLSVVPSGRTALQRAQIFCPDLVIMDAKLADGNAADIIEGLRLLAARPDLPVLLLANNDSDPEQMPVLSAATDYLAASFSPPMLRTRVRAWLARTVMGFTPTGEDLTTDGNGTTAGRNADHLQMLRLLPLFQSLTASQLERVLENATEQTFSTGEMIIRQGDSGRAAYVILSGRVRIVESVAGSPVEVLLGELGFGEVFGELGVVRERPRSASVLSLENTACLVITEDCFIQTLQNSMPMSMALIRILAGRLHDADRLLARHAPDLVTGLPGRRAFHELYRRLTASARRRKASVLLLAIDVVRLKDINDHFGYNVGDDVLRTIADALLEVSRSTDVVSRYGADEFVALLVEAKANDAQGILERVRHKVTELSLARTLPLSIVYSVGYSVSKDPPESADELVRAADLNRHAKRLPSSSGSAHTLA